MFDLCKYKDIIGKPGTGTRKYRIFDIAIVDTVVTFIGAWIIGYMLKRVYPWWNIPGTIVGIFILGIIAHRMFCVRTGVDKMLFPNAVDS